MTYCRAVIPVTDSNIWLSPLATQKVPWGETGPTKTTKKKKSRGPWPTQQDQRLWEGGKKKNPEECPYGFSLTARGHRLQCRQPTQTCSYTRLRFWQAFQVPALQMSLQGAEISIPITSVVVWVTLKNRVYIFAWNAPRGDLFSPRSPRFILG